MLETEFRCLEHPAFSYYARLQRVHRFVGTNFDRPIHLDDVARVAGCERTYFSRFFREKTGVTFTDWLSRFRVKKAVELLGEHNLSITELAGLVGYQDLRTFERSFKEIVGVTPVELKRRLRPS